MLWPLSETLKIIRPYLPAPLVSRQTYARIRSLARVLPHGTSSYYIECRLTADARQVDFLTCAVAARGGHTALVGHDAATAKSRLFASDPLWCRLHDFLGCWAAPASALYAQVPLVWLEFDHVDKPLPPVPLPGFSFCLDPDYVWQWAQQRVGNSLSVQHYRRVIESTVPILLGQALRSYTRRALFACFDSLPDGGRIIHLSAMPARRPAALKVYGSVPKKGFVAYLGRIGWTGAMSEVRDILRTFCTAVIVGNTIFFDLTIEETLSPRLGIAFSQQQIAKLPQRDPTRRALLDRCVEAGLCTPQKHEALTSWSGTFGKTFHGHSWPTRLRRWLDLKIVYQPHCPLEAKGYLGFMPSMAVF